MLRNKKIIFFLSGILFFLTASSQHPDFTKIDSLKKLLPKLSGIRKVDCLNELGEEIWWPPKIQPDSVFVLADAAYKEAVKINYAEGIATSIMLFGVVELYKKNFLSAEKYLRDALSRFEINHSSYGLGWTNIWLAQTLCAENDFVQALSCYNKSIPFLDKIGDWEGKGKAWVWMAFAHSSLGNYDSSFYYCSNSLLLRQKMSDYVCASVSLTSMGQLYKAAGANDDALDYYHQGYNYAVAHNVDFYTTNWAYLEPVGAIFRIMNLADSSYDYLKKAIQLDPGNYITHVSLGETLLLKNELDSALAIFLKPIDHFKKGNDKWDLMRVTLDAAKTYHRKKEEKTALRYALESYSLAKESRARQYILENYSLLYKIYQGLGKADSAFFFLNQYTVLKDSIVNTQFLWKLSSYKKQEEFKKQMAQLTVLDKENKLKEDELRQETLLQWILVACLIIFVVSGFIIYKNLALKRKNEKLENLQKQAVLQRNVTELEMQALRAQMNPHFIFNCLSSINRFILKSETEDASNYLTKFSRLIRMVLNNSKKSFINIEEELEMLSLYMDMEKLRFKDSFDYKITFLNSFDAGNIFIPPLLLQPFIENSIWHGLMHKKGHGHIEIELGEKDGILTCVLTDNGIGRTASLASKSKILERTKSMGLQITTERLALLNDNNERKSLFTIEDIFDQEGNSLGTRVTLKINYVKLIELEPEPTTTTE
ncbi:MAG: histidine kinase [Bacteroidetes bacterium]|nr:histidine kinase [Bacteroidota bacterium]